MSFASGAQAYPLDASYEDLRPGARVLVDAGGNPHLTVGPWFHVSGELHREIADPAGSTAIAENRAG